MPGYRTLAPRTLCAVAVLALAPAAAALTPPPPKAVPLGPELAVTEASGLDSPAVAVLPGGGFAVVWRDRDWRVLLRLFDAHNIDRTGTLVVGSAILNVLADTAPDLAVLGDGSLVVAWVAGSCPPGAQVIVDCEASIVRSHYSPRGDFLGTWQVGRPGTAAAWPRVAALPAQSAEAFVVVWSEQYPVEPGCFEGCNFSDVVGRVWHSRGQVTSGPQFLVNENLGEEQNAGDVAATADGGFIVVWDSWEGEHFYDVFRRRFRSDGEALEGQVQVNDEDFDGLWQLDPAIAALGDGSHVVVWSDSSRHDGGSGVYSIVGRMFDADMVPHPEEFLAHGVDAENHHSSPSVVAGDRGDFMVTGSRVDPADSTSAVFASYFSAFAFSFGELLLDQPLALDTTGHQLSPALAFGADGWVAVWLTSPEVLQAPAIRARRLGFQQPCRAPCLDGRFELAVTWMDFQGNGGTGHGAVRGDDWVTFWFFHPDNVELALKVLDGRAVNGRFWVFAGALTNVAYRLTVTDTFTGLGTVWDNPSRTFLSRADTATFEAANEVPVATGGASGTAARRPAAAAVASGPCPPGSACIQDGRFVLSAAWRDPFGNQGTGAVEPLTADTAWVSFFHGDNPELVVKVLDGRPVNGHFWVFYASLSNVEFDLTVTDLATGETATYANPAGTFASRGDTAAFPRE